MRLLPEKKAVVYDYKQDNNAQDNTYYIDFKNNRIMSKCDGKQALEQAIDKILRTCWRKHDIYDDSYGLEMQGLIGKDYSYIKSELKRRLKEALVSDKRVVDVGDFGFSKSENIDEIAVKFTVYSIFGKLELERTTDLRMGEKDE